MTEAYVADKFLEGVSTLLKKTITDLGATRGSLMVVDHRRKSLRIKVASSINPAEKLDDGIIARTEVPLGKGIAGLVAKTKEALLINDISSLKERYPELDTPTDSGSYVSSLVVPIVENGSTVAVLNISDKAGGGVFTDADLKLARMLGEYCVVALKLDRMNKGMLNVNEIIREISLTNALPEVYRLVVERGADIIECRHSSLMIVETDQEGESWLVVKESTDGDIVGEKRRLGESVSGYVWKTGEPVMIKKVEDGLRDRRFKILNKPGSFIVVPLNLKYKSPYSLNVALKGFSTIGVLNFTHRYDDQAFTDEQLEALVNYSNLVAIAIEKARFYNDSKLAYLSTVRALSAALESKDSYTKGHADSVERICSEVGGRMGFTEKEMEDLQIAAVLHDIGKIGIPESILNKKGKLTNKEYERIKTHIEEAEAILKHAFYLDESRDIICSHHERHDGAGYPAGLKGDEIPVGGRILALADAFHAMTSNRPYRKALPLNEAVEEIARHSGVQFDPKVVEVFLELVKEGKIDSDAAPPGA